MGLRVSDSEILIAGQHLIASDGVLIADGVAVEVGHLIISDAGRGRATEIWPEGKRGTVDPSAPEVSVQAVARNGWAARYWR